MFTVFKMYWRENKQIGTCNTNLGFSVLTRGLSFERGWHGMLVVSLRDVNFGFWSHLGCSGQSAIVFSREGLELHAKKDKNHIDICLCFKQKARDTPRLVSFRGLISDEHIRDSTSPPPHLPPPPPPHPARLYNN